MHKSGFALTVGVADFAVVLPFAQQEDLSSRFRRDLENTVYVGLLHHQDQIRFADGGGGQLIGFVLVWQMAMLFQYDPGGGLDRVVL